MLGRTTEPPSSSTGVGHTYLTNLTACVDWFSCTFKSFTDWENVRDILGLDRAYFELLNKGKYGYKNSVAFNNIKIFFDGSEGMGVYLEMSGAGCREYEEYFDNEIDWNNLFALCLNFDINIPRLDIAIDDFQRRLNFNTMIRKVKRGELVSKFKTVRDYREFVIGDGSKCGETIYFGKSDVMFRFYDKLSERINKGYSLNADIESWQRYEVQLRNERAFEMVKILSNDLDIGDMTLGLFKEYLSFRNKSSDSNKSRWKESPFWVDFLKDVEKVKLTNQPPEKSIMKTKEWVSTQVVSSLAMLKIASGNEKLFHAYIDTLGRDKMTDKQLELAYEFNSNFMRRDKLNELMLDEVGKQLDKHKFEKYGWGSTELDIKKETSEQMSQGFL